MSAMKKLIAIVDDEEDILNLVSLHLTRAGYNTENFIDSSSFFSFLEQNLPDLVILDLMLPDADGFEVCKHLKKDEKLANIPIIMLTARDEESDKVLGLELGADDYVTKPFSARELVARVKAVLRRQGTKEPELKTDIIKIKDTIVMDLNKYEVFVNGKKIDLTPTEFKIMQLLASRKGWVFSRNQILDYLWKEEKYVLDRTIDVHIRNLREKLGESAKFIKSVRGIGYKLEEW
ncbi:TPA: response regulator transcription factor [Candidatus Poribacteria bacterium]|nr:response regulator transcription factor [Candidatus Poribacteria bacterium]